MTGFTLSNQGKTLTPPKVHSSISYSLSLGKYAAMSSEISKAGNAKTESTLQHVSTATAINVRNLVEFDDPHKAAIDSNPEHAQRPPLTTLLAIWVSSRPTLGWFGSRLTQANSLSPCPHQVQ